MKLDGPPRLTDDEASELGRALRLSGRQTMDAAASARLAQRLQTSGAFEETSSAGSMASGSVLARLGSAKFALLGLVALGGAAVTWRSQHTTPPTPSSVVALARTSEAPHVTNDPSPAPVPATSSETMPSISVDALPSSTASAPARAIVRPIAPAASTSAPTASHASAPSEAEFALIRRAQLALTDNPTQALALTDEHARTFPNGELTQERELTAVEALARLGRMPEATNRAQALLARFPRTPYVARIERALAR
ncbi:hypothetical protein AKJ09_04839 [Labilithrix luteola]|uniref:Outer membrane lipoprotein BamD-like domain-containing protein n=1 Tax=Labilithrix luteola TaxID=1391654 RepID=A0A0K1PXB4_9BACT|nr:hypothetical protein [Labilithrix luteola]AKU98175.1 hypothetical protein AKJ09_04839 [Labilithrix luteola]